MTPDRDGARGSHRAPGGSSRTGPHRASHAAPQHVEPRPPPREPGPPERDASMELLGGVMYRPVALAPAERDDAGAPTRGARVRRDTLHLLVAGSLGLLLVAGVATLRAPQPAALEGRTLLLEEISQRTREAEELAAANQRVGAEIAALQEEALRVSDPGLVAELERFELASGAVPVRGDGVVVELDDPEVRDDRQLDPEERVQDLDVQLVVNGLWAAGAEAVAVNDQRLTALSAIRGAGEAILVDLTPLSPPYRVEAVGDPRALQTGFARSSAAAHLSVLASEYGITSTVRAAQDLELPGAGSRVLRHATAAPAVTSSGADPEEGTS
ncbi:DUF881 domain-containing protein [Actinotalea sp. AC32]|nr:DUF881 domain-containing protein [Actinotalea sp. AC32]